VCAARFDTSGNVLWSLQAGGSGWSQTAALALDAAGTCYLAGQAGANTFGSGTVAITNVAPGFGYLMKISPTGTPLWLHKVNNAGGAGAVTTDALRRPLVAGWVQLPGSDDDILLARFDAQGNLLGQATAGGAGTDRANGVATAVYGTIYVTGTFQGVGVGGAAFGTNHLAGLGGADIFMARLAWLNPPRSLTIYSVAVLPSGVIRLSFGYDDHSSVDANLPYLLTVLATDDLRVPRANWQRLNSITVTADGTLQLDDPDAHERQRYYQVLQAP
jgi:hypothetical protein